MDGDAPIEGEPVIVAGIVTVPLLLFDMPATPPDPFAAVGVSPEDDPPTAKTSADGVPSGVPPLPFESATDEAA